MHCNLLSHQSLNHFQSENSTLQMKRTTGIVENHATTNNAANHAGVDGQRRFQQPAQIQRRKIPSRRVLQSDHGNMDKGHQPRVLLLVANAHGQDHQSFVHEKPSQRNSWDPHGIMGWYLGPAQEHYRCYRTYINKSHAEKITDTIEFFPVESHTPKISVTEAAIAAAEALAAALKNKNKPPHLDDLIAPSESALQRLSDIFLPNTDDRQPPRVVPTPAAVPAPRVAASETIANRTRSNTTNEHRKQDDEQSNFFAGAVFHPETGSAMTYWQLITDPLTMQDWQQSATNKFGQLAQGIGGRVKGTDTIRFIKRSEIPTDHKPTHPRFVCEIKPHKVEVNRT
jgi:hypothetical protein